MENPRFLLESVKDVVTTCRKYSDATIVLGGAGYSIFPQAALDFLSADIGIQRRFGFQNKSLISPKLFHFEDQESPGNRAKCLWICT